MVREDAKGVDLEAEAEGGECEAVEEDLLDHLRGEQEELPLGCAAGEQQGASGEDLAGLGHDPVGCERQADRCWSHLRWLSAG